MCLSVWMWVVKLFSNRYSCSSLLILTKLGTRDVCADMQKKCGRHFQNFVFKIFCDVVQPVGMASTRTGLRFADSSDYSLPHLNTRVGEHAFAYGVMRVWPPGTNHPKASAGWKLHLSNTNSRNFSLHSVISLQTDNCFYYSLILVLFFFFSYACHLP